MNSITETFVSNGLHTARMISYSKSTYRQRNPDNEVYFNANIFVLGEGKVWLGDLDVTKDRETLQKIATEIGKDLYIVRELDGRFENENLKDSEILKVAVCKISR
jgi:hypothetical protein